MNIPRMTPFRQIYRAYSTLIGLRGSVDALTHRVDGVADRVDHLANRVDGVADAAGAIEPTLTKINEAIGSIQESIAINAKKPIDLYERHGFTFVLDKSSLVDRSMIETSQWEPGQVDFFTRLLEHFRGEAGNVFLDIGSYWGLYSFLALKSRLFDKIYTFEADPNNFAQLQANIFLNRAAREITAFNKAVSLKPGFLNVWNSLCHPDGNRGGVGIVADSFPQPTSMVESITIDGFLQLRGRNIAAKIDVEGHEFEVLSGMEQTIRDNRVIMQVEIYPAQYDAVFPLIDRLGLHRIHQVEHDFYLTNIAELMPRRAEKASADAPLPDPALTGHRAGAEV
ncbi:TPA: FkbM family methyltransferase [Burkholderia multivorans]|nr:FkbM family methyltransferase [Burkholderia multivorans]HDR9840844.1 FkbM family methyltransferase [Burkholderia multivorans]HDR9847366.1 FkbM family methyltransferase [Burkholderia multivorans]HDR9853780.1 FkbM family methyltransferase [Burkholderia multivorans]